MWAEASEVAKGREAGWHFRCVGSGFVGFVWERWERWWCF